MCWFGCGGISLAKVVLDKIAGRVESSIEAGAEKDPTFQFYLNQAAREEYENYLINYKNGARIVDTGVTIRYPSDFKKRHVDRDGPLIFEDYKKCKYPDNRVRKIYLKYKTGLSD